MNITQDMLRNLFDYKDGNLINKRTHAPRSVAGTVAGTKVKTTGYWRVTVNKQQIQLSRAIWIWHHGEIGAGLLIDHVDRNVDNNCINNLRLATYTQNEYNKPRRGCSFDSGKWRSRIKINGKSRRLGSFDTEEEASEFYDLAASLVHGQYKFGATL